MDDYGYLFYAKRLISMRWVSLQNSRQARKPFLPATVLRIRGLTRNKLRVLIGVLTGHFHFKKHLSVMGVCEIGRASCRERV